MDAKPAQDVKVMDQSSSENHATPHVKRGKDKKSKSETYNQTWTMEEQQILDRLLQEYPHGISNRQVSSHSFSRELMVGIGGK